MHVGMRIANGNKKCFKMADFEPKPGTPDSRRQSDVCNQPKLDGTGIALPSQQRKEWCSSSRSSSLDSGISELPSSPHSTPSPLIPHSPTTGPRPSSGDRIQCRPASKRSYRQFVHKPTDGESSSPTNSRPSSAFSNYTPLPNIGKQDIGEEIPGRNVLSHQTESKHSPNRTFNSCVRRSSNTSPASPSAKRISTMELRRQQFARRRNSQNDDAAEPLTTDEPPETERRILLAIKIPNGQRLQRYFHPSDDFTSVCTFAEMETKQFFSKCNMFINQVPKRLITNWKETFHEAGLTDRTLLCLEEKDD